MTFNPVSYFAGIGTVFVAVAVGFGGGLLITKSDPKVDPPNRLERAAASAPLVPTTVAAAPASTSPKSGPQQLTTAAGAPVSDASPPVSVTPVVAKSSEIKSSETKSPETKSPETKSPETKASEIKPAEPKPPATAASASAAPQQVSPQRPQPAETTRTENQPASGDQPASPREAFARSQDQDADVRRRSERSERRQADRERRKWRWVDRKQRQQQDLDGAAEEVRNIDRTGGRREDRGQEVVVQKDEGQRDIFEMPRLGFFGQQ
jgi:hypothetical protein